MIPPLSGLKSVAPIELRDLLMEWYSKLPPRFSTQWYALSLMHDQNQKELVPVESFLTYMFVHSDFTHLLSNLTVAFQSGIPVQQEFGTLGMYALFVLGGVAAILPSPLHNAQLAVFNRATADSIVSSVGGEYLPVFMQRSLHSAASFVGSSISNIFPRLACGSSGAVCAITGAQAVIYAQRCFKGLNILSGKRSTPAHGKPAAMSKADIRDLAWTSFSLWRIVHYITSELELVILSPEDAANIVQTEGLFGLLATSHSGHVQGFAFGAAFAVMYDLLFKE